MTWIKAKQVSVAAEKKKAAAKKSLPPEPLEPRLPQEGRATKIKSGAAAAAGKQPTHQLSLTISAPAI
jgi:hypothetical protein